MLSHWLVFLTLSAHCWANARQAAWIYPPHNSTYAFNTVDSVVASWTTTYDVAMLRMWCKKMQDKDYQLSFGPKAVWPTGSRRVLLNIQADGTCHFKIANPDVPGMAMKSADFSIKVNMTAEPQTYGAPSKKAPTTTMDASASAAPTEGIPPLTSSQPSTAATPTEAAEGGGGERGLTTGQVGGITAGSVLFVAFILAYLRHRRHAQKRKADFENRGWIHSISNPKDLRKTQGMSEKGYLPRMGIHEAGEGRRSTGTVDPGGRVEGFTEPPSAELVSPSDPSARARGSATPGDGDGDGMGNDSRAGEDPT